jgi:CubicO group peptidase (beta-lactamase class C family)
LPPAAHPGPAALPAADAAAEVPREVRWHLAPAELGLDRAVLEEGLALLAQGVREGRHAGAQVAVSRHGRLVLEYALGEAAPGRPLSPDHLTAWFSACKPATALAIALLLDRGALGLDDPVRRHLPDFGAGKERCTLRHVLTHQGGFAGALDASEQLGWEETLARISAYPAEYEPGSRAGYHSTSGWYVLGEVVRRVDGRPIERFLAEELFAPLEMTESRLGIPLAAQPALEPRLARVQLGRTERAHFADAAFVAQFNGAAEIARVNPSGGLRGPARELVRLYELLLAGGSWNGRRLLDARTVALFTACHRWGVPDQGLMGAPLAWGLGFGLHGNADYHRDFSRRVFGHSGMVSTVGLGDPARGLACAVITTGLLDPMTNARRLREATGSAVRACLD